MVNRAEIFKEGFKQWGSSSPIDPGWVALGVGVVMLLVVGLSMRRWWRLRQERSTPIMTFLALGRRLGLDKADQWLLFQISRHQKLPSPITLMLSATTLSAYGQAYVATRGPGQRVKLKGRLNRIALLLFEGGVSR